MSDTERSFIKRLAQRNWLILVATMALSLLYGSPNFTAGVAAGGLLAIGGFWWQQRALQRILAYPSPQAARGFQVRYFMRLAILGLLIYVLIGRIGMHPIGLALGLSVVVINIFCTAIVRAMRDRK